MKQTMILEQARKGFSNDVSASGASIAIVCSKVSAVISGGRLTCQSDGGADDYCTVEMDNGQTHYVCGAADDVLDWLGLYPSDEE